ncbi:response regulator [uncultured Thiodictyon sp.]|uniref:response regulator n=1 Tax=uncultured Thiodictyon sp. TaxID=1846217 RepID=UPI0025EB37CA|nr:response regulator [uncultured Thiodictyon sp.]
MAKLLVVDDSATERDHLREVLVKAGHTVVTAVSGQAVVALAQSERPDLIFMDIVMEGVDGYHATRALREDPTTMHIPVVVVSSKNQKADKMWAQLQGAKGYIVKPYAAEEILKQIAHLLGGGAAAS